MWSALTTGHFKLAPQNIEGRRAPQQARSVNKLELHLESHRMDRRTAVLAELACLAPSDLSRLLLLWSKRVHVSLSLVLSHCATGKDLQQIKSY